LKLGNFSGCGSYLAWTKEILCDKKLNFCQKRNTCFKHCSLKCFKSNPLPVCSKVLFSTTEKKWIHFHQLLIRQSLLWQILFSPEVNSNFSFLIFSQLPFPIDKFQLSQEAILCFFSKFLTLQKDKLKLLGLREELLSSTTILLPF